MTIQKLAVVVYLIACVVGVSAIVDGIIKQSTKFLGDKDLVVQGTISLYNKPNDISKYDRIFEGSTESLEDLTKDKNGYPIWNIFNVSYDGKDQKIINRSTFNTISSKNKSSQFLITVI